MMTVSVGRLFLLYAAFFLIYLAIHPGFDFLIFNRLDFRYEVWVRAVIVPFFQIVILLFLFFRRQLRDFVLEPVRTLRGIPAIGFVLIVDCFLLVAGWLPLKWQWAQLGAGSSVPSYFAGFKAVVGGLILAFLSLEIRGRLRRLVAIAGLLLCAYGLDYFYPWIGFLPASLSYLPRFAREILLYGTAYVSALLFLFFFAAQVESHSKASAILLRLGALLSGIATLLMGVSRFGNPAPDASWGRIIGTFSFAAISAFWLAISALSKAVLGRRSDPS